MRLYVVEDELFQLEDMLITLETLGHECVGHGKNPMDILEEIENLKPDLVLMDIHLDENNMGIRLARKVKALFQLPIIFTSSDRSSKVVNEALDVEPITYLTKPVQEGDLQVALMKAEREIAQTPDEQGFSSELYVKKTTKLVKVKTQNILFAYSDSKNYCSFKVVNGERFTFRNSITQFLKLLPTSNFIQVHRSHIINLSHIDQFDEANQVIIIKEDEVPVGRTYKPELMKYLKVL